MNKVPTLSNKDLYNAFPDENRTSVRTYANQYRKQNSSFNDNTKNDISPKQNIISKTKIIPPNEEEDFDDTNIKKLLRNWSIRQVKNNSRLAGKAIDVLLNPQFIEQGIVYDNIYWTSDTPPYMRPEFLYDHQKLAMELMEFNHILWQASRQLAGKTTAALLKDVEDMITTPHTTIALVAPTVPLAQEVLFKFLYEPMKDKNKTIMYNYLKPYFIKNPNTLGFTLKNGSRLMILSLNIAGSQGRSIDILHIEEIDKLGTEQSKRQALAGIINSVRANPEALVRITSNNATGIFRLLKQELFDFGPYFPIYVEDPFVPGEKYTGRHSIINEDVLVKSKPAIDQVLKIFSEVLVSFQFAEGQLYNIDNPTDECFNPEKVFLAYKKAETFDETKDYFIKTTMGIDPGGKVDAFGVSIWSLTKSGLSVLRWCKRFFNATHEAKQQAKEIAAQYIRFRCEGCQSESSAGAPWSLSLINHYVLKMSNGDLSFRYEFVNFAGEGKILDKQNFVYLFKILLDYELIVLYKRNDEERNLQYQITKYIPIKSESNSNPDDLVESGFHGIWQLLGGFEYIRKLLKQEVGIIGLTTQE